MVSLIGSFGHRASLVHLVLSPKISTAKLIFRLVLIRRDQVLNSCVNEHTAAEIYQVDVHFRHMWDDRFVAQSTMFVVHGRISIPGV